MVKPGRPEKEVARVEPDRPELPDYPARKAMKETRERMPNIVPVLAETGINYRNVDMIVIALMIMGSV